MKRKLSLFISDIVENVELILHSTEKVSKEKFNASRDLIDATVRRLEIIGEAVKNIPGPFREKYPRIPWRDIAGFRDAIVHGYFKVDLNIVWRVIKEDLPELIQKIRKVKEDLEKEK
jgi:uncharacterized protein with HEPN domain